VSAFGEKLGRGKKCSKKKYGLNSLKETRSVNYLFVRGWFTPPGVDRAGSVAFENLSGLNFANLLL
jgi:hypothetical protein